MPRDATSWTRDRMLAWLAWSPVRAVGVAVVDHLDPFEDLEAEIEVIGARLVRQRTDRPRAEPGAGPVGGRDVERRADDGDVGLPLVELFGVGQERPLGERGKPAEHPPDRELLLHPGAQLAPGSWSDAIAGG